MNKNEMIKAIDAKVEEQLATIEAIKNNPKLSEATYRTQRYQRTHEIRNLLIIRTLLEGKNLEGDTMKWFESATTLTATRKGPAIVFHEGDNMLEVVDAHPNKTYAQLKKAMEEQGFHLEGSTVRK